MLDVRWLLWQWAQSQSFVCHLEIRIFNSWRCASLSYVTPLLSTALISEFPIKIWHCCHQRKQHSVCERVLYRGLAALSSPLMRWIAMGSDTWVTSSYVMEHLPLRSGHALCPAALSLLGHFSWRSLDWRSRSIGIPTEISEPGKTPREVAANASLKTREVGRGWGDLDQKLNWTD